MKKLIFALPVLLVLLFGFGHHASAQYGAEYYQNYPDQPPDSALLSPEELEDLVAPIALYPDPLIAQLLPAATFVDQIDQAARYLRQYGSNVNVDNMPWDVSVKAIAHYPDVLTMMDERYDWTVSLGQAYIEQPQDLMDAIQRLRSDALAQGNLYSTAQWQVLNDNGYISIVPASPQYVYVPVYDPTLVYVEPYNPAYPFITFTAGFVIGAWLDRDCDWHRHRVYYHGWHGKGWIARSRPHINYRRSVYINQNAATIHVNRNVVRHDTREFRQQLRNDAYRHREGRPVNRPPRPGAERGPEHSRGRQPEGARPAEGTRPAAPQAGVPRTTEGAGRPTSTTVTVPGGRPAPSGGHTAAPPVSGQPTSSERHPTAPAASGRPAPSDRHPTAPATSAPPPSDRRPTAPSATHAPAATPAPAPSPAAATRGQTALPVPHAPVMRSPGTSRGQAPSIGDVYRGRDVQSTQPASQSGFGGYGSSKDASTYRERGQSSRQIMNQPPAAAPKPTFTAPRPAPAAAPAAAPRPAPVAPRAAPAPRPAPAAPPAARPAPPAARPVAPAPPAMQQHR
ncbi:DUF3300 domain-containing protein [Geomonas sp.]|uniref:DUF3300 domain-containing protein n=1 Tax=Geomonas sp. TaxID=2651584 RepID=UPI002B4602CC|nr:DUF3300 domain-containing protein [Geomonas sp.]HJV36146.1 DUF3300 domain-containing protein [Geomonas sp.]